MLHRVQPAHRDSFGSADSGTRVDDEAYRLAILKHYEILDTPPEAAFERITALAASLFNAPISLISFLDRDRLWFKSHHGLGVTEVGRPRGAAAVSLDMLAGHTLERGFLASAPLSTRDGYDMGALSVIDPRPHEIDGNLLRHLKALADIVMDQLELRLSTRRDAAQPDFSSGRGDRRAPENSPFSTSTPPFDRTDPPDIKERFAHLTSRQGEIMRLVIAGRPSKIIAADLGISQRTVENHRAAIMKRTGATSLPALARLAMFASGLGPRPARPDFTCRLDRVGGRRPTAAALPCADCLQACSYSAAFLMPEET